MKRIRDPTVQGQMMNRRVQLSHNLNTGQQNIFQLQWQSGRQFRQPSVNPQTNPHLIFRRIQMNIAGAQRQRRLNNTIHQRHNGSGGNIRCCAAGILILPHPQKALFNQLLNIRLRL